MESPSRQRLMIALPAHPVIDQPRGHVRRITVEPHGRTRLDALVGTPSDSQGLTFYIVGFNQSMGPWEAAKCALCAAYSRTTVIACELPGFSRYGLELPSLIRHDLMQGNPSSWAEWTWKYLQSTAEAAKVPDTNQVGILAFSTGCSLAMAALPAIWSAYSVSSLTLVEPVALARRTLSRLVVHNVIDLLRMVNTVPSNYPSSWIRQVIRRQLWEPNVRYSPADFLALITMLASDDTQRRLTADDLPLINLARGAKSKLCPGQPFADIDATLEHHNVPGTTGTIAGFGHQLWHSLPAIEALARTFHPSD
jgi:hypothetical protein